MLLNGIYAQLGLILLILLWFALSNRRTNIESLVKVVSIALLLLGLWLGGVWVYPPSYGLVIISLIFAAIGVHHFLKPVSDEGKLRVLVSSSPLLLILPITCFLIFQGFSGRQVPKGKFIKLDAPFELDTGACVISGGISPLLNFHIFPSDNPRDLGQQYALDIIKVGPAGFRTKEGFRLNPKPQNIEAYEMFNTVVVSPCDGTVVEYQNDLPDLAIGNSEKLKTGGNGVVLQCSEYHVHLHHMKQGSLTVTLGDQVRSGEKLGHIGNSGNTIEPHLHLHAETIVERGNTNLHGNPVHMMFNGRFMARGDCF